MELLSICRKVYNSFRGKDVIAVQADLIDSLQDERRGLLVRINNRCKDNDILQSRINELNGIRVGMQRELHELRNKPDTVVVEKYFVMTQEMYDAFEKSLEAPIVNNNTTAHGAGYLCGIQRALSVMRQRFVTN